jgi:hypothetical protein
MEAVCVDSSSKAAMPGQLQERTLPPPCQQPLRDAIFAEVALLNAASVTSRAAVCLLSWRGPSQCSSACAGPGCA